MNKNIRNFSIIAHIDHGKSTLADRMLELTNTVSKREMKTQILDQMDLERERGITIKMQPVTMKYILNGEEYTFNLIDTPGHVDFSYEVSRSLSAVEGAVLLIDSTQGIEAQTFSVLKMAQDMNLKIIPALSKIDSNLARIDDIKEEIVNLLDCEIEDIIETSGKTGDGVENLLKAVIDEIKPPSNSGEESKGLIFDFLYSRHTGINVYVRMISGEIKKGDQIQFIKGKHSFTVKEVGEFSPKMVPKESLSSGEIGYIITGVKETKVGIVGDTIVSKGSTQKELPGYYNPPPVIWASLYPQVTDEYPQFTRALQELSLNDSSLTFEEETSDTLGKGYRCGFLGMLHLEIITERIKREYNIDLTVTTPSTSFKIETKDGTIKEISTPSRFPDRHEIVSVFEPWVRAKIIIPNNSLNSIMQLLVDFETQLEDTTTIGKEKIELTLSMPLRELMRNFFDQLKSASSGYASLSYEKMEDKKSNVTRLDVLVAEELYPAFTRIVPIDKIDRIAKNLTESLSKNIPRQMFVVKIQAVGNGRIISSKTLSALRKDVTAKLYGGDITRKMKLREKQKKGKDKMKKMGRVSLGPDVFIKVIKDS